METNTNLNQSGQALDKLSDRNNLFLLTPRDLNPRIDSRSSKKSTLDLMITLNYFALNHEIKTSPHWSSDHIPVIFTLFNHSPFAENNENRDRIIGKLIKANGASGMTTSLSKSSTVTTQSWLIPN